MDTSLPIVLTGSRFHWHRWWWDYKLQNGGRQRGNEFIHYYHAPFIITIKLNARGPYIHPLATQSSIPPLPGVPQFITPITQCSIEILILELPPTAILPFNPPNHQSVPRTGLHLISWPFYTPINFRNVTFQVFTLITTYQSYPTMS